LQHAKGNESLCSCRKRKAGHDAGGGRRLARGASSCKGAWLAAPEEGGLFPGLGGMRGLKKGKDNRFVGMPASVFEPNLVGSGYDTQRRPTGRVFLLGGRGGGVIQPSRILLATLCWRKRAIGGGRKKGLAVGKSFGKARISRDEIAGL